MAASSDLKFIDAPVHRPGSTQNTLRSIGSLSGGTIRSLPITLSCLPPVTISPASRSRGRCELLINTSWFTCAPPGEIGIGWRRRIIGRAIPDSVTTTSPERSPSSSVRNPCVSCDFAATTGNTVRLPCLIAGRTLYPEPETASPARTKHGISIASASPTAKKAGIHSLRFILTSPELKDTSVRT